MKCPSCSGEIIPVDVQNDYCVCPWCGKVLKLRDNTLEFLNQKSPMPNDFALDIEWDVDANLPLYTRDYLKMEKEKVFEKNQAVFKAELEEPLRSTDNFLTDYFKRIVKEGADRIETACEQSLLDPKKRGVLVIQSRLGNIVDVSLSEEVPFGSIHIMRKELPFDRPVSPPAEGG